MIAEYKSFVRPHLDYGDIIYDQSNNVSLSDKTESVQYNAALAITVAIKGTLQEKLYQQLGLSCLKWFHLKCLPIFMKYFLPFKSRNVSQLASNFLRCRTELFQNSILTFTITEWNILDPDVRNVTLIRYFARIFLVLAIYNISNPLGIKPPNRLQLGFSYLR